MFNAQRPCTERKSKLHPDAYSKEELVDIAIKQLGMTKTQANSNTKAELCEKLAQGSKPQKVPSPQKRAESPKPQKTKSPNPTNHQKSKSPKPQNEFDPKRSCTQVSSKLNPTAYTKDELVDLAVKNIPGMTLSHAKQMTKPDLCKLLSNSSDNSIPQPKKDDKKKEKEPPKKSENKKDDILKFIRHAIYKITKAEYTKYVIDILDLSPLEASKYTKEKASNELRRYVVVTSTEDDFSSYNINDLRSFAQNILSIYNSDELNKLGINELREFVIQKTKRMKYIYTETDIQDFLHLGACKNVAKKDIVYFANRIISMNKNVAGDYTREDLCKLINNYIFPDLDSKKYTAQTFDEKRCIHEYEGGYKMIELVMFASNITKMPIREARMTPRITLCKHILTHLYGEQPRNEQSRYQNTRTFTHTLEKAGIKTKAEYIKWMIANHPDKKRGSPKTTEKVTEIFKEMHQQAINKGWFGQ